MSGFRLVSGAVLALHFLSGKAIAFDADLTALEVLGLNDRIYVYQLRVGETALVAANSLCRAGDQLRLHFLVEVVDESKWRNQLEVRRLPNNVVTLVLVPKTEDIGGNPIGTADMTAAIRQTFLDQPIISCSLMDVALGSELEEATFEIQAINSETRLSDLLEDF